jgi:hypothetical protein
MASVDWMYPSKGRSSNGRLAVAFEIHNIASTQEKPHEIKETHHDAGLALFKTFSLTCAFTSKIWGCTTFIIFLAIQ